MRCVSIRQIVPSHGHDPCGGTPLQPIQMSQLALACGVIKYGHQCWRIAIQEYLETVSAEREGPKDNSLFEKC